MPRSNSWILALAVLALVGVPLGCPDSDETPTITLTATDCEKDKISVTASKSVGGSPSNWVVTVSIEVKCDGQPLGNAQLKYTSWIGVSTRLETDGDGKTSARGRVSTSERPGSLDVTVEIEGSDGTKTVPLTV